MLTADGPKVVEFNCRFGDPETEALLPLLASRLLDPMLAVARGERLRGAAPLAWHPGCALTTVVAAPGYPEHPRTGAAIALPPAQPDDVHLFHAGTARDDDGRLVTAGGRVFAVTGVASTMREAQERSRSYAAAVEFEGRQFRSDIGWRELTRAGAA
ncbi:MAG TPA: phosphoribosylglycinamide synthetase C domain-containing protein, partial [Gemmatimonadaceae bacterium]|nr:phosphoribosylglycinamide synthetase C domain-containing protein [Gemmatimonadaceae bacterium]